MASIMEGPLSKWTNVMKGWQYRWFVLDYNAGLLSYYTVSPRGAEAPSFSRVAIPGWRGAGLFGSRVEVARLGVPPYERVPWERSVLRPGEPIRVKEMPVQPISRYWLSDLWAGGEPRSVFSVG